MFPSIFAVEVSPILSIAMTWLPIIILISSAVALFIAVLIKVIYLVLQLFPKSAEPKK